MKKRFTVLALTATLAVLLLSFTACGSAGVKEFDAVDPMGSDYGYTSDNYNNYAEEIYDEMAEEPGDGGSTTTGSVSLKGKETVDTSDSSVANNRKIIVRNDLRVQTKEFDALMDAVTAKVNELGGYIESATIYGQAMDSRSTRSAEMVIRIPAKDDESFVTFLSENSVIIRRSVDTEDITLKYVDMESRLSALRAEQEALESLMDKATEMQDVIVITDKLTEVIQEIESYQSQLRVFDNLVDYCTVSLYIDEVEFTTQVEKQSTWLTIWNNLKVNFANMWKGVVAVFVFLISAIPYLIPFAVIGLVIFLLIRRSVRNRRRKNAVKPEAPVDNEDKAE